MMDEYYRMAQALPIQLAQELKGLDPKRAATVQEIRLRVDQPVQFTVGGKLLPATCFLVQSDHLRRISATCLQECFLHLCQRSVYAYEEELRQGYITIPGGSRVGVAGYRSNGIFSHVSSLNLRIARWITCAVPPHIVAYLETCQGGVLVAGAPGSGKTTFLRTLAQILSRGNRIVCVVDERGELMAGEAGGTPMAEKISCDVYTHCTKEEGILMALRCMNPHYIICDELGTVQEASAVEKGTASGVCFLASVHCGAPEDLRRKPQMVRLLHTGAFAKVIFLDGREQPGTVVKWMDLS